MADRRSGSNLGRAKIDWEEAFLYYASLPPDQRDYQTVAAAFDVSVRTVERHGRDGDWVRDAHRIDQDARQRAAEQLATERLEKLLETEKLVDATHVAYANQLVAGKVKISPSDLVRLYELRNKLWQQHDTETSDPVAAPATLDTIDPVERKRQVLQALHDAGVLQSLITTNDPTPADAPAVASGAANPDDDEEAAG